MSHHLEGYLHMLQVPDLCVQGGDCCYYQQVFCACDGLLAAYLGVQRVLNEVPTCLPLPCLLWGETSVDKVGAQLGGEGPHTSVQGP